MGINLLDGRTPLIGSLDDDIVLLPMAVPCASARSHSTEEFERHTIDLLLLARSQSQAARHPEPTWHQVHDVQTASVERGLERRSLGDVELVGLDEKSFGRGHHYGTVLSDLDHNRVLEVVEHREQPSAERALHALPAAQLAEIKVVALDMWPAFKGAAATTVPQADLVHDRFHVVKKELRSKDLKVIKAWGLRENFQSSWLFTAKTAASAFFREWLSKANVCALLPITKVATMLANHLSGLLSYIKHRVTNAVTEGFNSKFQMIKSLARGFRPFENYRIAILFHCGKLELHPQ